MKNLNLYLIINKNESKIDAKIPLSPLKIFNNKKKKRKIKLVRPNKL